MIRVPSFAFDSGAVIVIVALVFVSVSVLFFGEPLPPFPADAF